METARFETVTPDIAAQWLKRNINNRHLRSSRVELYARQIKKGLWVPTNHGIGFGADGDLYDGQHTLHACVKADMPIRTLVVRGLVPAAKDVIDTGVSRTAHDIQNLTDPHNKMTKWEVASARLLNIVVNGARNGAFLISDLREIREMFDGAYKDLHATFTATRTIGITIGPVVAALVLAHATKPKAVVAAAEDLKTGAGLGERDPILVLRNRLMTTRHVGGHRAEMEALDRTLIAIAARIDGHSRMINKLPEGGVPKVRARFLKANGIDMPSDDDGGE